jgi:hypothetical protein
VSYVAIGNDELGESVGVRVRCGRCNEWHDVASSSGNLLQFVRCGDATFVVGIRGHHIRPDAERARRERMSKEQRLAAAAPDLLVALEAMASLVARNAEIPWEVRAEAWRVIAKAKGDAEVPF